LPAQLGAWKQKIVAFAGTLGAPGLFLISFLDSSFLTFPIINDLLLIQLSMQRPARMPLYASMAALGSLLGCVLLFLLARKIGSCVSSKGRRAGRGNPPLGGAQWIWRDAGGGDAAAADAIQVFRARGGSL